MNNSVYKKRKEKMNEKNYKKKGTKEILELELKFIKENKKKNNKTQKKKTKRSRSNGKMMN